MTAHVGRYLLPGAGKSATGRRIRTGSSRTGPRKDCGAENGTEAVRMGSWNCFTTDCGSGKGSTAGSGSDTGAGMETGAVETSGKVSRRYSLYI